MSAELTTLPDHLSVVSHRMEAIETVSLGAWVSVGTRHEKATNKGITHLLEHMAFKGTERRTARQIVEEIEDVGGHLNAFTTREMTAFHATVLKENVKLALEIIADIIQNSIFEISELDRERLVVLQEIAQSFDTPEDLVFDHFQGVAFPEQPIGQPVLGFPKFIKKISCKDLISYRNTHYTPSRMVLSAAGNLDHSRFVKMVQKAFINLNSEKNSDIVKARYIGGDRREARSLEQTQLVIGFEGAAFKDPKFYATSLAATILGGGMSSRLFQKIREELGLVYSIYAFSTSYTDSGLFGIYAGTGQEGLKELMPILCDELRKATTNLTEKELSRAKVQLKAGIVMSLESTAARAEQIARQVAVFGRVLPIGELIEKVQSVDLRTVMDTIEVSLNGKPTVAAVGPIKNLLHFDQIRERLQSG